PSTGRACRSRRRRCRNPQLNRLSVGGHTDDGRPSTRESSVSMNLGIGLALACAAVTQLAFLCKHRGAGSVPLVEIKHPLRSARALLGSRWFAIGMGIAAVAWVLHVAALALAPLSVVQVSLATGVVMLAVLGDRLFGCRVGPREWAGVFLTTSGLVLLVITLPRAAQHSEF